MGRSDEIINDSRTTSPLPPDLEKQLRSRFEDFHTDLLTIIIDHTEASIETSRLEYTHEISSILDKQTQFIESLIARIDHIEQMRLNEEKFAHASHDELEAFSLRFRVFRAVYKDVYKRSMSETMDDITADFAEYLKEPISLTDCLMWSKRRFEKRITRKRYNRMCKCLDHFEPILEDKKQKQQ